MLPLFIVEPEQLQAADFDPRHWVFTADCLHALRESLAALGQPLVVRIGEAVSVLAALSDEYQIDRIWAHEETFNWLSYQRDRRVRALGALDWNSVHGIAERWRHSAARESGRLVGTLGSADVRSACAPHRPRFAQFSVSSQALSRHWRNLGSRRIDELRASLVDQHMPGRFSIHFSENAARDTPNSCLHRLRRKRHARGSVHISH